MDNFYPVGYPSLYEHGYLVLMYLHKPSFLKSQIQQTKENKIQISVG